MKKRLIALGLFLALVLSFGGVAAATGGTEYDPLVSVGYLEGEFFEELEITLRYRIEELMQKDLDSANKTLDRVAAGFLSYLGVEDETVLPAGWSSTEEFVVGGGERKDTVSLSAGSSILWTSGKASADRLLVDVTSGKEVAAGTVLTEGHRYLSVEQTIVTVSSRVGRWAVAGVWSTTSDGISIIEIEFTDVAEDSWYYDAVYYAVTNNLFNGTSETTFAPLDTMQRGMMTTVLHRMAGSPPVEYTKLFSDVPDGIWYTSGTIWCGLNGVVSGVGDGRFKPTDPVVRQQITLILYNYANLMDYNTSARGDLTALSDGDTVADWAREATSWAVSVGILRGSGGKLMPANGATRAEVATMLQRFLDWAELQ